MSTGEHQTANTATQLLRHDWASLGLLVRRTSIEAVATHFADLAACVPNQPTGKDAERLVNGGQV